MGYHRNKGETIRRINQASKVVPNLGDFHASFNIYKWNQKCF